ncbi:hypothetical protein BG844_10745 [Couchioplanes caeruleus subsp. caeruleus]|uniref:Uncharacterized protein n=1 Tax=Couchioplanes caeruleus subsp. caeruleus TaxID=56427 RepID=A0A1K0GPE9_9ACTN|nr:hypothetical protein [Couchioplanes caeruleus]OJF14254.1 hypothetical protein BG844_10745 [Couchioplanes caeruleus subsp. caeruleus]
MHEVDTAAMPGRDRVAQPFLEFPGAPEPVAVPAQRSQDAPVLRVETFTTGAHDEAGAPPLAAARRPRCDRDLRGLGAVDRLDDLVRPLDDPEHDARHRSCREQTTKPRAILKFKDGH